MLNFTIGEVPRVGEGRGRRGSRRRPLLRGEPWTLAGAGAIGADRAGTTARADRVRAGGATGRDGTASHLPQQGGVHGAQGLPAQGQLLGRSLHDRLLSLYVPRASCLREILK